MEASSYYARVKVSIWAETRRRGFRPETPLLNLEGSNVSRDGRVGTRSPEITLYTSVDKGDASSSRLRKLM